MEKPERIAALALLTVVGLLVYALIQRQVRLYLRVQPQALPGNTGPTTTPTAAVVLTLLRAVRLVQWRLDNTTGYLATPFCPRNAKYWEWYVPGTEPTEMCPIHSPFTRGLTLTEPPH